MLKWVQNFINCNIKKIIRKKRKHIRNKKEEGRQVGDKIGEGSNTQRTRGE